MMASRMRRPFLLLLPLLLPACQSGHALTVKRVLGGPMLYTVAEVDPRRDRLTLHWRNPTTGAGYGSFAQLRERLAKEGRELLFATNSGIYGQDDRPLGLHIEGGRELRGMNRARSGGNFALLPNGVFWLRGAQAGVTETGAFEKLGLRPDYATQSGPLLVSGGRLHPGFNRSGTSFKVRSGVGVCRDGKVRFAISAGPVNFYSFATFFRDTLGCPDALYLDGSISAYATPDTDTQFTRFVGIWAVTR